MGHTACVNQEHHPFFTIIVVCLNAGKALSVTVQSIIDQSFCDYEIIVKDGGSTDGSVQQLTKDNRIKLMMCPDQGLYHAMNQAVNIANGEYLMFLNCGDSMFDEFVLEKVYQKAVEIEKPSILYGHSFYENLCRMRIPPDVLTPYFWSVSNICHQAVFFANGTLDKNEAYDLSYRIAADNELMVRRYAEGTSFVSLGFPVCSYEGGGYSESKKGMQIGRSEHKRIMKTYFSILCRLKFFAKHVRIYLEGEFDIKAKEDQP